MANAEEVEAEREQMRKKIKACSDFEEVIIVLGISGVSPEAYYAEIVWEALKS